MLGAKLRKLAEKFAGKSLFEYPVKEQKEYLKKFREPRSCIERSFFQYKAQMKLKGRLLSFCINLASVPLFFFYLFKPSTKCTDKQKADAVFVKDGGVNDKILPTSLANEFEHLESNATEGNLLKWRDRGYLLKLLLRYPLSWHFALKATIKMMRYRWFIELYQPRSLIVHNEYSFTSSLLTDFCNKNGVELINVMHGEKLFFMRDSFFKFNRCYIWNEFYKDLFAELRADIDQFIIEVPPSLLFSKSNIEKTVDFTYYLQAQQGDNLKLIIAVLKKMSDNGNTVAIRPHPRYTNLDDLNSYIGDSPMEVEDCRCVAIEDSILRTKNVISIYSTVLQQAYYNGTNVVIDDLSDPSLISKLKELKYVMLETDNAMLSDLIGDLNKDNQIV